MNDRLVTVFIALLRPFEVLQAWKVARGHRRGKFKRPADIGSPCVTTKQPWQDDLWEREHGHGVYDGNFQ